MERDFTGAITTQSVKAVIFQYMFRVAPKGKVTFPFAETHAYVCDHFGVDKEDSSFICFVNNALREIKGTYTKL